MIIWMSEEDYNYDLATQADVVVKAAEINILSDKYLAAVYVDNTQKVLGALFVGVSNDEYSFDVVVHPKVQGAGVGSALTDAGIENFAMFEDGELDMTLDVVNPKMMEILKRRGFEVVNKIHGHIIEEFLSFGRIKLEDHNVDGSSWVLLSDNAFKIAHNERCAKAARTWKKHFKKIIN